MTVKSNHKFMNLKNYVLVCSQKFRTFTFLIFGRWFVKNIFLFQIQSDSSWVLFFQHNTAIQVATELADASTSLFLLVNLVVSRGFRRRLLSLLRLESHCNQRLRRALTTTRSSAGTWCYGRMRPLKSCTSLKRRWHEQSPTWSLHHHQQQQPTWNWGKGWQYPSQTISIPEQNTSISEHDESQRSIPITPSSHTARLDPEELDLMVERHNAYAASSVDVEDEEVSSPIPAEPCYQQGRTSRRYIKNIHSGSHRMSARKPYEIDSNLL